jgi:N-acylneuraminate cytidylyltransferase/CMP-N,N'-diacetyllegionaminic acid synthase
MNILGIIGARSGSKGVKDKNIRQLLGKPLLGRIIETSKKSKYISRVIVSTDSKHYAGIAREFGAEVPFLRPEELSSDLSPDYDYVLHAVKWLKSNEKYEPDIVIRLMATVPLQTTEDIDLCIEELMKDNAAHSAVVISRARQHPLKALKLMDDKKGGYYLVSYFSESGREVTPTARQNYEKAYFRSNIIACQLSTIYNTGSLTGDRVRYHIIPQERAIDIDSEADFLITEELIKTLGEFSSFGKHS